MTGPLVRLAEPQAAHARALRLLTEHLERTFVVDHGDEMPDYFAREVLEVLTRAGWRATAYDPHPVTTDQPPDPARTRHGLRGDDRQEESEQ